MVCKSDDLNSYRNLLTALICTFNQGGTGTGKSTYWLDPLLRLKNRTSPGRKKHKQVHFSSVEEHRQRHWGIRCGQAKWPVWWGRDAEWVKRSRVGNAKVTLGRVQSWHHGRLSSVQFSCSVMSDFCHPMNHSTPGLPVHYQLLEFTQTHVHWVSDAIRPSHPLSFLLLLPSIFPSIRVFSNESALRIRWPRCLLQHYLHQPGQRRKLNVHSQMNG